MDHKPLLAALVQSLKARLQFRETNLGESLQNIISQAVKTGNLGNGRLGLWVAKAHEDEARIRAEIIVNDLRQARLSWSPKQIVEAQHELKTEVSDLFKNNLSQAASLAEQMGPLKNSSLAIVLESFREQSDKASKTAMSMVDAALSEVIAAASNDLTAQTLAERPSYVNHFHGPVGAVAQGNSTVSQVRQENASSTPQELAEAISQIIRLLPRNQHSVEAIKGLEQAEGELRSGKVPMGILTRSLDFLSKGEDLAIRAPEALEKVQKLMSMLGMG